MTKGTLLRRLHLLQQQLLVQSSGLQYHSRHALSSLSTTTTHITSLHQQKQQQQQQFTTLLQNNTNNSNMSIKPTEAATSSCCNYSSTSPSLTEAAAAAAEAATTESSSTPSVDASNDAENQKQPATLSSPKLQKLYDRIIKLSEEEVNILGTFFAFLCLCVSGTRIEKKHLPKTSLLPLDSFNPSFFFEIISFYCCFLSLSVSLHPATTTLI